MERVDRTCCKKVWPTLPDEGVDTILLSTAEYDDEKIVHTLPNEPMIM